MNWPSVWNWISDIIVGSAGLAVLALTVARLFGKNLVDEWFNRRNRKYELLIDKELSRFEAELNNRLELLRISYGNVFSERITVFKEACVRIQKIETFRHRLATYQNYPCKEKIDFASRCAGNRDCPADCILNYKKIIREMMDYMNQTEHWFHENEFFFSLDQLSSYMKMMVKFMEILAKTAAITADSGKTEREKAIECFDAFAGYDNKSYDNAREELIASFRYTAGVPRLSADRIAE